MLKRFLRVLRNKYYRASIRRTVKQAIEGNPYRSIDDFNFEDIRAGVSQFVTSLATDESGFRYRFSSSAASSSLYSSAYACMALSLIGELSKLDEEEKMRWVDYFDSFQSEKDGLFRDPLLKEDGLEDTDWIGTRHIALHMISAYTDLGAKPKYPLTFLREYYDTARLKKWLDNTDWNREAIPFENDVDNKIMNICCLLQYQRDMFDDEAAGEAVTFIKGYLKKVINPDTGMWGRFDENDPTDRSRMVQFAYHLFPIFFYDGDYAFEQDRIVDLVLKTQNEFGGYGVNSNSSACEDIDSVDLLIRFYPYVDNQRRSEIDASVKKALCWVLFNRTQDNGFCFRLNDPLIYGSRHLSAEANQGAMMPTWFRVLSLLYISNHLALTNGFVLTNCPGYEVK